MTEIKMTGLGWMETTGKESNRDLMATLKGKMMNIIFQEEKMIFIVQKLLNSLESIFDYFINDYYKVIL